MKKHHELSPAQLAEVEELDASPAMTLTEKVVAIISLLGLYVWYLASWPW